MDPWIIPASSDDYVVSLHRRLGLELAARRAALGLSAYALGKAAGVTDQTILNLERGLAKAGAGRRPLPPLLPRVRRRACGVCHLHRA